MEASLKIASLVGSLFTRRPPPETVSSVLEARYGLRPDEYGAPVTFEPSHWLVCFVPGLRAQFWHRFVHKTHKHVLLLKPNGNETWTLFEPWWTRLLVRTISTDQAMRFLRWAEMGDVLLAEEEVPGRGSQLRGWANCAALAAFLLGRPYWVWSPHALFTRLLSETRTRKIDVAELDCHLAARWRWAGRRPPACWPTSVAGMLVWMPTSPGGVSRAICSVTAFPQSPPCAT
jgi:hypothetical protein